MQFKVVYKFVVRSLFMHVFNPTPTLGKVYWVLCVQNPLSPIHLTVPIRDSPIPKLAQYIIETIYC